MGGRRAYHTKQSKSEKDEYHISLTTRHFREAEAPILWPPDANSRLIGKGPDAAKDGRQEKGRTEDEMVGWHHQLNGHELRQIPGDGERQGGLACSSP